MHTASSIAAGSHLDQLYQKSSDSWWVFRHGIDPQGSPLPYGRVVYYARSQQEAQQWIHSQHRPVIPC